MSNLVCKSYYYSVRFKLESYKCARKFATSSLKYAVTKYNELNNYQVHFFLKYEVLYNKLLIQMETVITKDCFQISNVINAHL